MCIYTYVYNFLSEREEENNFGHYLTSSEKSNLQRVFPNNCNNRIYKVHSIYKILVVFFQDRRYSQPLLFVRLTQLVRTEHNKSIVMFPSFISRAEILKG